MLPCHVALFCSLAIALLVLNRPDCIFLPQMDRWALSRCSRASKKSSRTRCGSWGSRALRRSAPKARLIHALPSPLCSPIALLKFEIGKSETSARARPTPQVASCLIWATCTQRRRPMTTLTWTRMYHLVPPWTAGMQRRRPRKRRRRPPRCARFRSAILALAVHC